MIDIHVTSYSDAGCLKYLALNLINLFIYSVIRPIFYAMTQVTHFCDLNLENKEKIRQCTWKLERQHIGSNNILYTCA